MNEKSSLTHTFEIWPDLLDFKTEIVHYLNLGWTKDTAAISIKYRIRYISFISKRFRFLIIEKVIIIIPRRYKR
jgi:hypothetical protein